MAAGRVPRACFSTSPTSSSSSWSTSSWSAPAPTPNSAPRWLALRHQLRILERKVGKPVWQPGDRILLAGLSRLLPRSGLSSLLPRLETLLRWHRELVRRKWAAFH